MGATIHPSSVVADGAIVGDGTRVWVFCQIREGARVGDNCLLGTGVYIDPGVVIGDRVKIQNHVSIYAGVTLEDGVFVGPGACFTNDRVPRAVTAEGALKGADDWTVTPTRVREGAAVGANATILCGVTIGRWAMVGAGSVVTRDVPDHAQVVGNPARVVGWVCRCGAPVALEPAARATCACGRITVRRADGVVHDDAETE